MEQWEYLTLFIEANIEVKGAREQVVVYAEEEQKYSPAAMIPELNRLGSKGWELVHMQPVIVGRNKDVLVHPDSLKYWSNQYFCVFKRRSK